MKLVHNIFLKFNDIQTYETEIKEDINKFVEPIGAEISYTVAFISKKMTGQHIILPPSIGFGEKGYKE